MDVQPSFADHASFCSVDLVVTAVEFSLFMTAKYRNKSNMSRRNETLLLWSLKRDNFDLFNIISRGSYYNWWAELNEVWIVRVGWAFVIWSPKVLFMRWYWTNTRFVDDQKPSGSLKCVRVPLGFCILANLIYSWQSVLAISLKIFNRISSVILYLGAFLEL